MTLMMRRQTAIVFCIVVLTSAEDYENNLTKLWSLSSAKSSDGPRTAVVNVSSASIHIQPADGVPRRSRDQPASFQGYRFKPRAIPLNREPTKERSVYYSPDNKYKSEILFPGNYFPIAEEKSKENLTQDAFNPLEGGPFQPKTIPLMRGEFQRRSLDEYEEPIIEKPEGFTEQTAQRRSISYLLGVEGEDEDEDEDAEGEYEVEEEGDGLDTTKSKNKIKVKPKKKTKKLGKYMMPLLLAYKMKYFAMVPLMIAGLVLLVGATGLAGFFFALFAAVMGLQKGSY